MAIQFDLAELEDYLRATLIKDGNDVNFKKVLSVATKLIRGEGIVHKSKPGEVFGAGVCLTLDMDLEAVRRQAEVWLPYKKSAGEARLDKGNGWALNHPIQKLIGFQVAACFHSSRVPCGSLWLQLARLSHSPAIQCTSF